MTDALAFARSILFNVIFFSGTAVACVLLLPVLLLPRRKMMVPILWYMRAVGFVERLVLGIDWRLVGAEKLPPAPYIVAAKHQSAWETMKLHLLLDDPAVVIKAELARLPLWGWLATKAGMIPVDRGARSKAVSGMLEVARRRAGEGRPIVIFPQGTRTAPGTWRPYKVGVAALYDGLGLPVVPMALNSGVFWGRRAFRKTPGTITVEILDPIPPGLSRDAFMDQLVDALEGASDRLAVAAGGKASRHHERARHGPVETNGSGTDA